MLLVISIVSVGFRVQLATPNPSEVSSVDSKVGLQKSSTRALPTTETLSPTTGMLDYNRSNQRWRDTAEKIDSSSPDLMNGMTVNAWSAEAYNSTDFDQSITNLANTGANWVTFTVFWFMNTSSDTEMHPRPDLYTASDSSLTHAIQKAHDLGMEVTLKPMVDVVDGAWRGQISPSNWTLWFANYRGFINYYANFSKANSVELFTVGTELRSSQSHESEWRQVINETRTRFSGNVTYAANWDSYSIYSRLPAYAVKFWDALDYVGVDGYFPLTNSYSPTVAQLVNAWSTSTASGWWGTGYNWTNDLYLTYINTGKRILFTEIGYTSQNGTNTQPWTYVPPPTGIDLQEQADCYQACLEVFRDKTWFMGWFWWDWETDPNAGGPTDQDYTPQNKPAQSILNQYYSTRTVTFQAAGTGVPVTVDHTRVTGNYTVGGSSTVPIGASSSMTVPYGSNVTFSYASPVAGGIGIRHVLASTNPSSPLTNVVSDTTATGQYKTQYSVTFNQSGISVGLSPAVVIIDGTAYAVSALPIMFWWDNGSSHTFAYQSPLVVTANSEQYVWNGTTGLSTLQSGSISVSGYGNVTGNYKTQYYLTVASPYDSPTPASGWFDSGASVTTSITSPSSGGVETRYVCTGWTGTGSVPSFGTAQNATFTITQESSITWDWKTQYVLTLFTDPGALTPQPTRDPLGEEGPANGWWYNTSTNVILTAQAVPGYTFSYWDVDDASQGSRISQITVTMNAPHTTIARYTTSIHDIALTNIALFETVISQGFSLDFMVTAANLGDYTETFNVTVFANTTIISAIINVTLTSKNSTTFILTWDTSGFDTGDYIISAYASPVPNETETSDNYLVGGVVHIILTSDSARGWAGGFPPRLM